MASQGHESHVTHLSAGSAASPGQPRTGWARVLIASAISVAVAAVAVLLLYWGGLAPLGFVLFGGPAAACGLLHLARVRPAVPLTFAGAGAVLVLGWIYLNSYLSGVLGLPGLGMVFSVSYGAAAALTAPDASLRLRISVVIGFVALVAPVAIGPPSPEQWVS